MTFLHLVCEAGIELHQKGERYGSAEHGRDPGILEFDIRSGDSHISQQQQSYV